MQSSDSQPPSLFPWGDHATSEEIAAYVNKRAITETLTRTTARTTNAAAYTKTLREAYVDSLPPSQTNVPPPPEWYRERHPDCPPFPLPGSFPEPEFWKIEECASRIREITKCLSELVDMDQRANRVLPLPFKKPVSNSGHDEEQKDGMASAMSVKCKGLLDQLQHFHDWKELQLEMHFKYKHSALCASRMFSLVRAADMVDGDGPQKRPDAETFYWVEEYGPHYHHNLVKLLGRCDFAPSWAEYAGAWKEAEDDREELRKFSVELSRLGVEWERQVSLAKIQWQQYL